MAEVVNTNLEKAFLAKIMNEPDQFHKVKPHFFGNADIRLVYDTIRESYIKDKNKIVPSKQQILTMVSMVDSQGTVSREVLKMILKEDLSAYDDDWLSERFQAWKVSKHTRDQLKESIDLIRNMDEIDYDNVIDIATRLKEKFAEIETIGSDVTDFGDDFDDPESHRQLIGQNKMSSGWSNIDKILGGGWDRSTLNLLMAPTNSGKCADYQTVTRLKNKKTGEIVEMMMGDFHEMIKNNQCK